MTIGQAVSKRIDYLLSERDMSLYKLAKIACLPVSTLQNLYRGHTKSPTLAVVIKVCDALEISVGEFLDDDLFNRDILEIE